MKRMTRIVYATVISVIFGCFALPPQAQAVLPSPDGGYGAPTYGDGNTAEGEDALFSLTGGDFNTATGYRALHSNTVNSFNTAIGAGALFSNTADDNTAVGAGALLSNTAGTQNTATGGSALFSNTTGDENTAVGESALLNNTVGIANTATGSDALRNNINGRFNTANGDSALGRNSSGSNNTATGNDALANNTIGFENTAVGDRALYANSTGSGNTATGISALPRNTVGVENTANGSNAMFNNMSGRNNTAIGNRALFSNRNGSFNTALGYRGGANLTTGSNNIDIGNVGVAAESNTIRIGGDVGAGSHTATFIAAIRGVTTANNNAIPVVIDSDGQLGTVSSSSRYKTEIKPIDKASESILALKPVSFHYKVHKDTTPQFGLIAEDVARENPDLVIYDGDGKPYTVRYDAVNAMLLNEFLKEHKTVRAQGATIARLEKQIEALNAGLQKMSAQIELNTLAPQTVCLPVASSRMPSE